MRATSLWEQQASFRIVFHPRNHSGIASIHEVHRHCGAECFCKQVLSGHPLWPFNLHTAMCWIAWCSACHPHSLLSENVRCMALYQTTVLIMSLRLTLMVPLLVRRHAPAM